MTLSTEFLNNIVLDDNRSYLESKIDKLDLDSLKEMISVYGTHGLSAIISERIKSGQFDLAKLIDEYKGGKHI